MKKHNVVVENDSFLGITSVSMEETPVGWEITAEFRYKCQNNDVITFVVELPGKKKISHTAIKANKEITAAVNKVIILPKGEKGKFVLKGQLGKDKAVIAFSILNDSGEIIHG